jgi:hypothetical protein
MRDDDKLAFADYGFVIAKLHAQHTFDYEEKFVFNVVMMPDELAFDFDDFHGAIIDNAKLALIPVIGETAGFFLKIYGFRRIPGTYYKAFTMLLTAVRTRCVVSAREVSEYKRKRFSVPEGRTITQPISPR